MKIWYQKSRLNKTKVYSLGSLPHWLAGDGQSNRS